MKYFEDHRREEPERGRRKIFEEKKKDDKRTSGLNDDLKLEEEAKVGMRDLRYPSFLPSQLPSHACSSEPCDFQRRH